MILAHIDHGSLVHLFFIGLGFGVVIGVPIGLLLHRRVHRLYKWIMKP